MKDGTPDNFPDDSDADASDTELLRRFAARDARSEAALAVFVRRRVGFVYGAALRRTAGDARLAEEIAQSVFLLASQKASTLARHEHLAGWLHTTTSLTARCALRDARLRRQREQEAAAMNEFLDTPDISSAAAMHMREMLDNALDHLGQKDRDALLLRFFEERPYAEVSAVMKIDEAAARMRVSRALDKLRAFYSRRGVTSTAAALSAFLAAEAAATPPASLHTTISGTILAGGGATAIVTTTATTAGVLAFMSSTKITIIAIAAALIMATFATMQVGRVKTATAGLDALKREHTALLKNVTNTQRYVKGYQTSLEDLRAQKAEAAERAANPQNPVAAGNAFLDAHPEVKAMLVDAQKSNIAGKFYYLYKEKNLTPEQIAQFEDYIRQTPGLYATNFSRYIRGIGRVSLMPPATPPPDEEPDPTVADLLKTVGAVAKESPSPTSLGLAYRLYYTDEPLTAEQGARMNQLFNDMAAQNAAQPASRDANWESTIKQAGEILSKQQMTALEQLRDAEDLARSYTQLSRAAAAEAAKQSTANANTNTK